MQDNTKCVFIDGVIQSRGFILFHRILEEIEFLVIKSVIRDHWTLPKGRMLEGEDDLEAARREVFEEVGIKNFKEIPDFCVQNLEEVEGEKKCVRFYLGKVESRSLKIDNKEVVMAEWLPFEEAFEILASPHRKESLRLAHVFLQDRGFDF